MALVVLHLLSSLFLPLISAACWLATPHHTLCILYPPTEGFIVRRAGGVGGDGVLGEGRKSVGSEGEGRDVPRKRYLHDIVTREMEYEEEEGRRPRQPSMGAGRTT